jgi:hypothetical protein
MAILGSYFEPVPYLFLEEDGKTLITSDSVFPSQTFRRAIAAAIGVPTGFDWRIDSGRENAERTVDRFGSFVFEDCTTNFKELVQS